VFAHCDLLSGNVIIQPRSNNAADGLETVSFIDYEYATPSPAAFDLANHFAEWGGFDCEHDLLPTRSQRFDFIREYIRSYFAHLDPDHPPVDEEAETRQLFDEVKIFRGIPGFYWGIWALIQATISQIDFDYASYAEIRLGEYWSWREESDGSREASGKEMSLREKRWAQEA
jgi:ethanolamine kinase